jgi:hypothetical protein
VRLRLVLLALSAVAALAGCGGDEEGQEQTVTATQTTTFTESAPQVPTAEAAPAACSDEAGNEIEIVGGDVDCAEARATASGYDTQGARVQEVGDWTCEGGNATTRPVIFTCSQAGREFVVREPGG